MYSINTDNPIASQTNFLWQLDRLREWKSEGDSFPVQKEINPTNYCSEAYRWCITNYSQSFNPSMSKGKRQSEDRKRDVPSINAKHSERRRELESKYHERSRRGASCSGVPRIRGEENGVKYAIKVIHKKDDSYWVSGEAQRGNDKHNIEQGIDDEAEFARILIDVKALLMALFDEHSEVERGKIISNADDSQQKEDDLKSIIRRVELTDESWQQYYSNNLHSREIIEGSGLVCGEESSSLHHVSRQIKQAGHEKIRKVLIMGEHGTGKELVAEAIRDLSPRKTRPYIALHIGIFPEHLIASELFGHMKGTFTGATFDKKGAFEEANNGILFLDEIGKMSIENQKTLLRVLEVGVVQPLGSTQPIKVDVLIISATNANLKRMIREGSFGEDLYYRLYEVIISLPPLRERPEDIPALVQFFSKIDEINQKEKGWKYDEKLFKALIWYDWPGNIRQLKNFIMSTHALSEESKKKEIGLEDLKFENTDPSYHELQTAYRKYQENSEWAKLILKLADIAAKMFTETWEVLENAWERWRYSGKVSLSNLELEKGIFHQQLDNRDSQRLEEIIQDAWEEFRRFLKSEGYSGIQNSNCYTMLMSCYGSKHNVKNIEKAVKGTLKSVLAKLGDMKLDLSNQYERENYDRFKEFFGKTYRSVWDWTGNEL